MTRLMLTCWLLALSLLAGCASMSGYTAPAGDAGLMATVQRAPADSLDISTLQLLVRLASRGYPFEQVQLATASWTAPTSGSPPQYYRLEVEAIGPRWRSQTWYDRIWDTSFGVVLPADVDSVRGRVAGVDDQGREGDWSPWPQWCGRGELVDAGSAPAIAQERQP